MGGLNWKFLRLLEHGGEGCFGLLFGLFSILFITNLIKLMCLSTINNPHSS